MSKEAEHIAICGELGFTGSLHAELGRRALKKKDKCLEFSRQCWAISTFADPTIPKLIASFASDLAIEIHTYFSRGKGHK